MARPAAARLAARRAGARRRRGRPRGARRGRRRRDARPPRADAVLADELRSFASRARAPAVAAGHGRRRRRPAAVAVPRPGRPADDEDATRAAPSVPAPLDLRGLVAAAAGAPRAGRRRRRRAGPRGGAHARPAGRGRRRGRRPGAVVGPRRAVQRRPAVGRRTSGCRSRRPRSRPRSAARCGGRSRRRAGPRPRAAARTSARCCTRSPRSTRRAREAELSAALDRRWGELGLGTGWPALATRRKADAMVHRLAVLPAHRRRAAPGRGRVRRRHRPRDAARVSVDRIERVDDGPTGRSCGSSTSRPAPARRA